MQILFQWIIIRWILPNWIFFLNFRTPLDKKGIVVTWDFFPTESFCRVTNRPCMHAFNNIQWQWIYFINQRTVRHLVVWGIIKAIQCPRKLRSQYPSTCIITEWWDVGWKPRGRFARRDHIPKISHQQSGGRNKISLLRIDSIAEGLVCRFTEKFTHPHQSHSRWNISHWWGCGKCIVKNDTVFWEIANLSSFNIMGCEKASSYIWGKIKSDKLCGSVGFNNYKNSKLLKTVVNLVLEVRTVIV